MCESSSECFPLLDGFLETIPQAFVEALELE